MAEVIEEETHMRAIVLGVSAFLACNFAVGAYAQDVEHGREVFQKWCAPCHAAVSGTEKLAGTTALALKYGDTKPAALEQRTDLTPSTVKTFVRTGSNAMPFFRKTEVSDADLEAVAQYLSKQKSR